MKSPLSYLLVFVPLLFVAYFSGRIFADEAPEAAPLDSSFSYQGRLTDNDNPISDSCDFEFSLWSELSSGSQIGSVQTESAVAVNDGLFNVMLNDADDFGANPFAGDARWLEIAVRCPAGSGSYTTLSPRQPLTAAPYAHFSESSSWSGLLGMPGGFADGTDNDTTYSAGNGLELSGTSFEAKGSPVENIIVVAQSGGDFTTISSALNSITDASESNRYQIFVGPGEYVERVLMKSYVDIVGSGIGITRLLHNGSGVNHVVQMADNSALYDLSVENDGSGSNNFALGIFATGVTITVANVDVRSSGSSFNYALYLQNADATLRNVTTAADQGNSAVGMYLFSANVLANESSFTATDDTNSNGVYMTASSTGTYLLELVDSRVSSNVRNLRVSTRYDVIVANSMLDSAGVIELVGGTVSCVASRDDTGDELNSACVSTLEPETTSGIYAVLCSAADSGLSRAVDGPEVGVVDGGETGRCLIDFGFSLNDSVWTANAATASEPLLVSCEQINETQLSCLQTTLQGEGVDGRINIILH